MSVISFRKQHLSRFVLFGTILLILVYWWVWPLTFGQQNTRPPTKTQKAEKTRAAKGKTRLAPGDVGTYNMAEHTGSLKFKERQFILDDKPITILSGAMHYFRIPQQYWRDRMLKMKACGLNTLETYVPWNLHEEIRGEFKFDGILDIRKYIKLAHELGLKVIFRPGPYICSEWDLGGLPSWLLQDPNMKLRSTYSPYQDAVEKYFARLLPLVTDLQYSKGGPIVMVQIENEFGSYSDEVEHLEFIKELLLKNGITETLMISENAQGAGVAPVSQTLLTANFKDHAQGLKLFTKIRSMGQDIPLMVMEYWTGWFDHWGTEHNKVAPKDYISTLEFILKQKSSVNLYMFHGGTNFGFMAGANYFTDYKPDVTSYDYDAVLSEAGDLTPKFHETQELFLKVVLKPQGLSLSDIKVSDVPKAAYGDVRMKSSLGWSDLLTLVNPVTLKHIVTMEMLDINSGGGQSFGYIVYRKVLETTGAMMIGGHVRDRAQVLSDGKEVAVLDSKNKDQIVNLPSHQGQSTLDIIVENLGRVNYGGFKTSVLDTQRKGLSGVVHLNGKILENWQIFPLEFKQPILQKASSHQKWQPISSTVDKSPGLYKAMLTINGTPRDTFLNMEGWGKGVVFINTFNLGRYWEIGPQKTLYVPAPILQQGTNEILIFEQHKRGETITFQDKADLG